MIDRYLEGRFGSVQPNRQQPALTKAAVIEFAARRKAFERAASIVDMCVAAGQPYRAADFIRADKPLDAVRVALSPVVLAAERIAKSAKGPACQ